MAMCNSRFMRNNREIAWCLLLSLAACLGTNARCQEVKSSVRPPPPAGILLNAPPEFSCWTVTFSYPQDRPSRADSKLPALDGNLMRKVTVTKTREIIHEETVSVSGIKRDKWQNASKYYIKPQGQSYWGEYDATFSRDYQISDAKLLPSPVDKFRGLEWIGGQTYAGDLKDQGREYLLFVPADVTNVDFSNAAEVKSQPAVAYIDAATRLPVAFKNKDVIQQYTFGNAPVEMQSFPSDLAMEIKVGEEKRAKVFAAPHREY